MRKTISTQELKIHIGEVVDAVRLQGTHYIIERRGKPVAAVVPVEIEESSQRERREFFDLMERASRRNREIAPAKLDEAIRQSVREVRKSRSAKRSRAADKRA